MLADLNFRTYAHKPGFSDKFWVKQQIISEKNRVSSSLSVSPKIPENPNHRN